MLLDSIKHFLNMGGYAFYVWTAYGAAALIIGVNIFIARRKLRRILSKLKQ